MTGEVYLAKDLKYGHDVVAKTEPSCVTPSELEHEHRVLCQLDGIIGIPKVHWFGYGTRCNTLILDRLGPSLEDVFNSCHRSFCLNTIASIADQLVSLLSNTFTCVMIVVQICCLQRVHTRHIIHRDLQPGNILVGVGDKAHIIYLIDFSLSKQYRDPRTHIHIKPNDTSSFIGTLAFASINSHLGLELGRRDDLESLVYLLIYLVRGSLPWVHLETMSAVLDMKRNTDELCRELPGEFRRMLDYLHGLAFQARPDYDYLQSLVRKLCLHSPETNIDLPDWLKNQPRTTTVHQLHVTDLASLALTRVLQDEGDL